jgi:hypothetical protein
MLALSNFLPCFVAYFLCVATIRSTRDLGLLSGSLVLVGLYTAVLGIRAYQAGRPSMFVLVWPHWRSTSPGTWSKGVFAALAF